MRRALVRLSESSLLCSFGAFLRRSIFLRNVGSFESQAQSLLSRPAPLTSCSGGLSMLSAMLWSTASGLAALDLTVLCLAAAAFTVPLHASAAAVDAQSCHLSPWVQLPLGGLRYGPVTLVATAV